MLRTLLSRILLLDDTPLQSQVIETDHKLIARILDGEREIFAVSLDRRFLATSRGRQLFEQRVPGGGLPEWLADETEKLLANT